MLTYITIVVTALALMNGLMMVGSALQAWEQYKKGKEIERAIDAERPCKLCYGPTIWRCSNCHEAICQTCANDHMSQSPNCQIPMDGLTPKTGVNKCP